MKIHEQRKVSTKQINNQVYNIILIHLCTKPGSSLQSWGQSRRRAAKKIYIYQYYTILHPSISHNKLNDTRHISCKTKKVRRHQLFTHTTSIAIHTRIPRKPFFRRDLHRLICPRKHMDFPLFSSCSD